MVLAEAMGAPSEQAASLVLALIRQLGLPSNLRDVGLREEQLDALAQRSMAYPPVLANPRPIRSAADVREILAMAW